VHDDLFQNLDLDWANFERSRAGAQALGRWREEPDMADVPSLGDLVEALGERRRPQRQDALMFALLRLSRHDRDARRAVLKALIPALVKITRSYSRAMNKEDAASVVVLAAMERMTNYTASRPGRPAANLVQDVRYTVHRACLREAPAPAGQPQLVPLKDTDLVGFEPAEPTASEDLLRLLQEAVKGGVLSGEGGRVILLTRIADVPAAALAEAEGLRPSSMRKRRERAEAALSEFAMEVA
jgi:DNA-directed RNA polymerase specialized sigma24 family protein